MASVRIVRIPGLRAGSAARYGEMEGAAQGQNYAVAAWKRVLYAVRGSVRDEMAVEWLGKGTVEEGRIPLPVPMLWRERRGRLYAEGDYGQSFIAQIGR